MHYLLKRLVPGLIFLTVLFSGIKTAKADHVMGADMSYVCLGGGKYKIIIKFYRDCRGASAPPSWSLLYWYAGNNGGAGTSKSSLSLSRISIRDITPRCSTASSPCNPTNTSYTGEGVEEHTYETTIDISKAPFAGSGLGSTYCELTIAYNQCCRNAAITTGATWADFWTTAMINVCNVNKMANKCNTSPAFTNVPIAYACCNQAYYFNNGALDTVDYDSLSYSLAPALAGVPNTSVPYTTPFSYQYPVTPYCVPPTTIKCAPNIKTNPPRGFLMDTSTGDIIFTPTKCDEVGILVIEITEWRRDTAGVLRMVGKTRRDIQIIVKDDCGYNKAPTVEGPIVNKVCEGDKICFSIFGKDETFTPYQTIPDTVQMKWNGGIPGATFKIKNPKDREKEAEFCWQTKLGQASDVAYSFTVTATDDHCPKPSQSIRGFKVKVNPRAFDTRKYTKLKCGRFAFAAVLPSNFKGVANYKWSFRDSNGNNEFYFSSKKTDTLTFYKGGKYIVVHTVNNSDNCPTIYRDTIVIPPPPKVILATKDTFACLHTTIKLVAQIFNAKAPYKYRWTRPDSFISGDTLSTLTIPNVVRDSTIRVRITDGDGCKFYDTATVFLKPLPEKPMMPDQRICTYETATFDALHADTMDYLWNTGDTTQTITKHVKGLYIVTVSDTIYHCKMIDTAELFVNDTVVPLAGSDATICTNDKYTIKGNHRTAALSATYQWSDITNSTPTLLGNNTSYQVQPKNTNGNGQPAKYFRYELYIKINQGGHLCENRDTMTIKVNTLPAVQWTKTPLDQHCWDYGDINLDQFVIAPKNVLWNNGNIRMWGSLTKFGPTGLVDSIYYNQHKFRTTKIDNSVDLQNGKTVSETITLWFKDTNGCINTANTVQKINGNPIIKLTEKTYCQDKGSAPMDSSVLRPKSKFGTIQTWEVLNAPSGVNPLAVLDNSTGNWIMKFGTPTEDFYAGIYQMKFSVTDQVTGCFDRDTVNVYIVTEPKVQITPPDPVCVNWDTMDLGEYVLLNNLQPTINKDNYFTILEYNNSRTDPKVSSTKLINGRLFLPSFGAGSWYIKFSSWETGCLKEDSFLLFVNDTPDAVLLPPITLCEGTVLDLSTRVDNSNTKPSGLQAVWTGQWVSQNGSTYDFTANSKDQAKLEGPYKLRFDYTNAATGCTDTEYYNITVRSQPEIGITTSKPASGCENSPFGVQSTSKYDNGVKWTTINGSDGTFDNASANNITYTHGAADKAAHQAWIKVSTVPLPSDVCPQVSDSIQIILHPYPVVDFTSPVAQCVPFTADFTGIETSGIPSNQLAWKWDFGNGDTSILQNPTAIAFKNQGKYTVKLTVTNTVGPCSTSKPVADYVLAFPKPVASFTTDPGYKTTIALPKFKTFNHSSLDKSVFTSGYMQYRWDFGDPIVDPNDTSTQPEPRWAYGKDTNTYLITLIVKSDNGCLDTASQYVHVGPDIIVYIPDVFTPEGTGPARNETFMISIENYKSMDMRVYNRWGEKLYETKDPLKGWDGKANGAAAQQGVYIYDLEVTGEDGKVYHFKGSITLLR